MAASTTPLLDALIQDYYSGRTTNDGSQNRLNAWYTSQERANIGAAVLGELLAANNLSDLTNAATARTNLAAAGTVSPTFTGTVVLAANALLRESSQDTITAFAGGGQASATLLTNEVSRVTTVATIGDSVKLPASAAGLTVFVMNHGANSMQVFGAGTDTIDDVATATGVPQMVGSMVVYTCSTAGAWYSEGLGTGYAGSLQTTAFVDAQTAFATGGQTSATPITASIVRFTTVATAGDSAKLPASAPGLSITVINRGAADMQVFGVGTDTVDGVATATGVSHPSGAIVVYTCTVTGNWTSSLAGQGSFGLNRVTEGETVVTATTTVTAAQLLKGFIRGTNAAAAVLTLDTSANLDAAIPAVKVGHSFAIIVTNNSGGANNITFAAGTGQTFYPPGGVTVAQNKTANLTLLRTGAGTWNVYHTVGA